MTTSVSLHALVRLPVASIKGVGARFAEKLEKLGLESVQDVLFHLPLRYLDRTRLKPIGHIQLNTSAVIEGRITGNHVAMGRRRSLVCMLEDASGSIALRFFHFTAAQKNQLAEGTLVRCYGEPKQGATGLELYHPEYDVVQPNTPLPTATSLTPIYGLTEGVTQNRMRTVVEGALTLLHSHGLDELLPAEINQVFKVESLSHALDYVHNPPANAPMDLLLSGEHPCQQRLVFEELLAHFLARQQIRQIAQSEQAPVIGRHQELVDKLLSSLPFMLTQAQQRVIQEVRQDFAKCLPMLRMVQGDVGSGKTLVAATALLDVIGSGYQVALVAPTEILAEQHLYSFTAWLEPLGFNVGWLVGKITAATRRKTLEAMASGDIHVVVGTHALFQEDVIFKQLGLAIIDEQHRFGVGQRLALRQKSNHGETPHQLIMTATPIPRTLAMTAYAELDYSVIDELPPNRTPVNTLLVSQTRRSDIVARISVACTEGKQVYWVCTLVEDSETLAAANAEETAVLLAEALPDAKIGLIHGRLKPKEKEEVMNAFKQGELQLLVATTVIEVGVDVPNASLMVIENPERLGLAQLHQLRGRVGRGKVASHCVLLYGAPLSRNAKERLQTLRSTNDGFAIAEKDLELRGPGEYLGTRQTGDMEYRLANLERDGHLIPQVYQLGATLIGYHPDIVKQLIQRWFGKSQNYGQV